MHSIRNKIPLLKIEDFKHGTNITTRHKNGVASGKLIINHNSIYICSNTHYPDFGETNIHARDLALGLNYYYCLARTLRSSMFTSNEKKSIIIEHDIKLDLLKTLKSNILNNYKRKS